MELKVIIRVELHTQQAEVCCQALVEQMVFVFQQQEVETPTQPKMCVLEKRCIFITEEIILIMALCVAAEERRRYLRLCCPQHRAEVGKPASPLR